MLLYMNNAELILQATANIKRKNDTITDDGT